MNKVAEDFRSSVMAELMVIVLVHLGGLAKNLLVGIMK